MSDDRPRGVLAPVDREFLRGSKEYGHRQSVYDRKATIRERVEHGFRDMEIVLEKWPAEERKKVFTDPFGNIWTAASTPTRQPKPTDHDLGEALVNAVAFVRFAATDMGFSPDSVFTQAAAKAGKEKMKTGEELAADEKAALLEDETMPTETLTAYVRGDLEQWEPDGG